MLRSILKRNLFPIALITLGGIIFLAIILYLFRAHLAVVGWVMLGLLMIGAGVIGIVASSQKAKNLAGEEPSLSSQAPPGTPPSPLTAPKRSTAPARGTTPGQQDTIILSRPVLIGGGVLLVSIVLLLLCNLGTALLPLFTVRETQIVDCREAPLYAEDGWRVVLTYSYSLEDAVSDDTIRTDCMMEQERFVWAGDKRTPKDDASTDDTSTDDAPTALFDPAPYLEPTQTLFTQSPATQLPPPSPTSWPTDLPLPAETPPPSASGPTNTPLPLSPTATPIPRTDIDVCEAALNDTYLNVYVQWEGMIMDDPTDDDEGLWFQVSWTNSNLDSECGQTVFFVSYDGDERLFEEDTVAVTGTIINTNYEYEDESGQTEYSVVVRADNVEFLQ